MAQSFFDNQEPNSVLLFENSQLLLKNHFQFIHPYDMEPCKEVVAFDAGIDWEYIPFDDEEWNYMLNRQEYLLDLCVSFDITSDKKYLEKGKEFIFDWISKNGTTINWRTIDTGIRLTYWQVMLFYLKKESLLSELEKETVQQSIHQQITYLDDNYIDKYDLSNWGILITTGFFIMTKGYSESCVQEIYDRMLGRLKRQLRLQIQPSGNHWEQSPLYFMEVLRSLVFIHQSQVLRDDPVQKLLEEKIFSMYRFMPHFVTPNGTTILQGDTDEMRVNDVIQTISLIYKQPLPVLFGESVSVDYMMLYFSQKKLTITTWKKEIKNNINKNSVTSMTDDYTGNYYFRSDWSSSASYCHLYNGNLGSGHGHLSLGHVDLSLRGDNLFVDSGRLTYTESELRETLKESTQHNTVVINEQPFGNAINSWGYSEVPTSLANRSYEDSYFWSVRSMYLDNQLYGTFKVVRTVLYLKELDSFVILDQVIETPSSVFSHLTRQFHLNPNVGIKKVSTKLVLTIRDDDYYLSFGESNLTIEPSVYSPKYNELVVNEKIITTSTQPSQALLVTPHKHVSLEKVHVSKTDNGLVEDNQCFALKVTEGSQEWLIYSMIEDTYSGHKLYLIDNHEVYGQLGVVKVKSEQELGYTRLF